MLLAIDIGNTNIVIGCIEAEKICHELRLATDLVKTSDQYWMDLKGVLALYDLQADEIEGVIISSVVPELTYALTNAVELLTGKLLQVLGIVGLFERGGEGIVLALLLLELRGKGLLFGLSAADLLPEVQKVRADEKQKSEKQQLRERSAALLFARGLFLCHTAHLPFVPRRAGNAAPTVCNFLL